MWWIDATLRGHAIVIEWSKEDGFGLSTPTEADYGSAANEVYTDADEAVARAVQLLKSGGKARARREMHLQALREHRNISQDTLAKLMELSQASISKTERRGDMLLSTLQSFIEALGGELRISAKFRTETIELDLLRENGRKRVPPSDDEVRCRADELIGPPRRRRRRSANSSGARPPLALGAGSGDPRWVLG